MAITPLTGTDTVSYIDDTVGNKATAAVVVPVNADGTAMGGGTASSPNIAGGEYNSTLPTLTNGQTDALQFDSTGKLFVVFGSTSGSQTSTVSSSASDGYSASNVGLIVKNLNTVFNGTSFDRMPGNTTGTFTLQRGTPTIATNQVSVATTATSIVAARTGRSSVTIVNGGTTDVFIGAAGVTTTTGILLTGTKGASITLNTSAQVFGIVGTGTQTVSFIENY